LENLGIDVKIMLKWMLEEQDSLMWTEFKSFRIQTSGGPLRRGNKPPGCITDGLLFVQLNDCQLLKKNPGPWNCILVYLIQITVCIITLIRGRKA
jgi:hypothetical protein